MTEYPPVSYSLAPCRSCKSDRVMLIQRIVLGASEGGHHVKCLGYPADPPFSSTRVECGTKTRTHSQWPDAVDDWNRKNG